MAVELSDTHRKRLIRARGGETMTETAERIGVTKSMLSMLESGTKQPSEDLLHRWAESVGLSVKVERKTTVRLG